MHIFGRPVLGRSFSLALDFACQQKPKSEYRVFIHIYPAGMKEKSARKKKLFINADTGNYSVVKLKSGYLLKTLPQKVFIPKHFPAGKYVIAAGLFRQVSSNFDPKTEKIIGHHLRLLYKGKNPVDFTAGQISVSRDN